MLGFDTRSTGRLEAFLADRLIEGCPNQIADHLIQHLAAILGLDDFHRGLARPESRNPGGLRQTLEPGGDFLFQALGRNRHGQAPTQGSGGFNSDLHRQTSLQKYI